MPQADTPSVHLHCCTAISRKPCRNCLQSANLLKVLLAEPTQAVQHQITSRKSFIRVEIPAGPAARCTGPSPDASWQAAALPRLPTALRAALGGEAGTGGTAKRQFCVLSPAQGLIRAKLTKTVHSLRTNNPKSQEASLQMAVCYLTGCLFLQHRRLGKGAMAGILKKCFR